MFEFLKYTPPKEKEEFDLTFGTHPDTELGTAKKSFKVSEDIGKVIKICDEILNFSVNGDIKYRTLNLRCDEKRRKAFLVWVDGLANTTMLNDYIIRALMSQTSLVNCDSTNITFYVENVIHQGAVSYGEDMRQLLSGINTGNAVLFIEGCTNGASFDIKTWEHRGIDSPVNEAVVQGPHEGFNEVLRCNSALIRKSVNSSNLIMETYFLGSKSKTPASLAYIDGIINEALLGEIKKRLSKIDTDYVLSSFDIEKMLEEKNFLPMPQIISTERPDKVTRALIEGRAALILNGSSDVLILPSNITDIISSPEDAYLRSPYSVFIKFIRILAVFLSLLTPGIYLALTSFHTDALLTDMLITLSRASQQIAFSPLTEIIVMELAFELIKEAGVRIPGAIGSSLGIVGGLILGQSAVSAGLVSPIVIIIVSVCGIASFAIPSYSLSFSFRITRFVYIFAGALLGMIGIISVLCIQLSLILGTKSFGVPLCVPFSPKTSSHPLMNSIFNTHYRVKPPSYLKAKKENGK